MQLDFLILTVWAGILATYLHMVFALWAPHYGLPRLDFGKVMAELCFAESFEGKPPYWLGLVALHLNGILFALLYATLVGPLLPGPLFVRGLLFGGILLLGSQLVFVPVFLKHGFFGLKAHPRAWMTAFVVHGIYGGVLGWLSPVL
jgi:hypothetical protein